MVSSQDWLQSCTALSTTDSSIMLEDTVGKHKHYTLSAAHSTALNTLWYVVTGSAVLTWLLFHCIQDPFNNIIQFRRIDRLQHLHKIFAGFTVAQNKKTCICCCFFLLTAARKLQNANYQQQNVLVLASI